MGEKQRIEERESAAVLSEFLVRQMTLQTGGLGRGSEGQRRRRETERETDKSNEWHSLRGMIQ